MTNEQILKQFQDLFNEESKKVNVEFEARMQELKSEPKTIRTAPKWNLNTSVVITDVTPEGYGI